MTKLTEALRVKEQEAKEFARDAGRLRDVEEERNELQK